MTVEFVTRRVIARDGERVHRLLVTDRTGQQFPVLVPPDSDPLLELKTGATYRISGLLGAAPPAEEGDSDLECPHCGGQLREGQTVDAVGSALTLTAELLGLDEPFGIVDSATTVREVQSDDTGVDDWTPISHGPSLDVPDYVCTSSGRTVDARELRPGRPSDAQMGEVMHDAAAPSASMEAAEQTVGMATGGAKDASNFRQNVVNGYTPQPEAISDEGLFYDYTFETGEPRETDALFAPRYATAVSEHPLSGETERYLSVGLDSTLSLAEFERPRLDLVAVLDVSGSMDNPFDSYYYDEHGREREVAADATTKLDAATGSLCALTEQLREDDRLGVVLYNHRAHVAKPLRDVGSTDMDAIRGHIREVAAGGSTNLADGFEAAVDMLVDGNEGSAVERRVVFMTDMMPNTGATGTGDLTRLFADAAERGIHTTFVGMGLDANAELADALSGIRGANHYFVHSASEFERRLGEEFDYLVTPLVYDLELSLEADGCEISAVHGSPSADEASDRLLHVGTLFPSVKTDGEARGGVILVRLERVARDADLELVASWMERDGTEHSERVSVAVPADPETFAHDGVRKAVALSRYARELRRWARDVHGRADRSTGVDDWLLPDQRGRHERESVPLVVPDRYGERFQALREYLERELEVLDDETLQWELDLLETLCEQAAAPTNGVTE